jgi:hypothetical protein
MTVRIVTYHRRVSAPREIAELTDYLVLKQEGSRYRPRRGDTIINWGCSEIPEFLRVPGLRWLNTCEAVATGISKRKSFEAFAAHNVPHVQVTYDLREACQWHDRGKTVIQRNTGSGRQGEGIVVCNSGTVPDSRGRMWTKYFDRKDEYRVHVMGGQVIDVQKKRLKTEVRDEIRRRQEAGHEIGDVFRVRSYPNGWVFCREGVVCPAPVLEASIAATRACGLDFAAVDVGFRRSDGVARVFEVNTAPGIEATTVQNYATGLRRIVEQANYSLPSYG